MCENPLPLGRGGCQTAEYVAVVEKDLFGFKSVVTTQLESTTGLVDTITKTSPLFKTRRGRYQIAPYIPSLKEGALGGRLVTSTKRPLRDSGRLLNQPWLGVSTNLSERFALDSRRASPFL